MAITSESRKTGSRRYGSIQLRYAMTYVVVTFFVLLFLNVYCSRISQMVFYGNKQNSMLEKALLSASSIEQLEVMTPANVQSAVEKMANLSQTRLIVTDDSGLIVYDTMSSGEKYALLPQIISALQCNDVFTWHYSDGVIRAEAAVPITNYDAVTGCVYIVEHDTTNGALIKSLQNNIFTITLVLELFVILFSVIYASRFSGRLRKVMNSMRIIQEGDYSHKVDLGGHDELTFLGQKVNDLTERLQISESKRHQFVSDASHELKTPLASIKLLSDSILQYDMDLETTREFVSDIGNEAERLNRMTQKLLSLTKSDINSTQLEELEEKEIIYMAPTINQVVKMLSSIAEKSNITLRPLIAQDVPVMVREDDLYQIIYNLVENGIKYNQPGGNLSINLQRRDDMAVLKVRDTGVGIPEDAIEHVFERFYRVDKARSRQSGGSGLGLAIVKTMVERNNGDIFVESKVGEGSVFTVEFPCFDIAQEEEV